MFYNVQFVKGENENDLETKNHSFKNRTRPVRLTENSSLTRSDSYKKFNCTFNEINSGWTGQFSVRLVNLIESVKKLTYLKLKK